MRSWALGAGGLAALALAAPARADVALKADNGFVVRNAVEVTSSPAEVWQALLAPAKWWSGQHTFSGDAANLTLDPVPGGCFCERLPAAIVASAKGLTAGQREGGVQHMRVIYAEPLRAMRLTGALGPLQSEALSGTLTMTLKPVGSGTRILWEYVVGGFMRYKTDDIAPAVDKVLLGQLSSLAAKLGPIAAAEHDAPAAPTLLQAEAAKPDAAKTDAAPSVIAKPAVVPAKAGGAGNWSLPPTATKPAKVRSGAALASPTPAAKPATKPGLRPVPPIAVPPAAKPARKTAPKAPSAEEIERREAIEAFDAALGKAPAQ